MIKIPIDQCVASLSERDEYKCIVAFIRDERERLFSDLGLAMDSHEIMKIAGGISRLDELLQVLQ